MTNISPNSVNYICAREIYESVQYPITKDILFRSIKSGDFPPPMKVGNAFFLVKADVEKFYRTQE